MIPFTRLMLITQKNQIPLDLYLDFIKKCADGGITSLQLREKSLSLDELTSLGEELIKVLDPYGIPLVINDFPQLAKLLDSSYIHVGQNDESVAEVLDLIPQAQIGISIESLEDLHIANLLPLSYVTASAVFPTDNKLKLKKIWGLEGLRELSKISTHPLTAIGGITIQNVENVIQYGAQGIAIIGALHDSEDPYRTAKKFRSIMDPLLN